MSQTNDPIQNRLKEIAAAIAAGTPASKFDKELNKLLGTEMAPRNRKAEAAWEAAYRGEDVE